MACTEPDTAKGAREKTSVDLLQIILKTGAQGNDVGENFFLQALVQGHSGPDWACMGCLADFTAPSQLLVTIII